MMRDPIHRGLVRGANVSMNRIIKAVPDDEISKKLTKIVCTIGPASANVDKIVAMIKSGKYLSQTNLIPLFV